MMNVSIRPLYPIAAAALLAGCASTMKQDAHSGADAKVSGAQKIKLDEFGAGASKGIVTYPGGDRVDWKVFELPKGGDVEVVLKWRPPRPGLDLSMNILDDTFHMVKRLKPSHDGKVSKSAELSSLPAGKYYVQVYASGRGDAGEYTVEVKWYEHRANVAVAAGEPIPNPPRLPGVPEPKEAAGGGGGVDKNAPLGTEQNPCTVGQPGCTAAMLYINPGCPTEKPAPLGSPCPMINPACPEAGPLMPGMPCPPKVIPPRAAKIIERQISGSDIIVTLNQGQNQGIAKGWTGVVFKGRSGNKILSGSDFTIFKVTEDESYGKIRKLSMEDLGQNTRVELKAPPAGP